MYCEKTGSIRNELRRENNPGIRISGRTNLAQSQIQGRRTIPIITVWTIFPKESFTAVEFRERRSNVNLD